MPEMGTSGLMSGDGKRGGARRQYPRPSSTLPGFSVGRSLTGTSLAPLTSARPLFFCNDLRPWLVESLRRRFSPPAAGVIRASSGTEVPRRLPARLKPAPFFGLKAPFRAPVEPVSDTLLL